MAATRAVTAVLRPSARFLWPVPATDGVRTVGPMWAVERLRSGPDLTRAHLAAGAWDEAARPHMGTAALTYLLPRSSPLVYRDGCGNKRMVRPGDAAVSVAGRGLACGWRASPAAMLAPAVPGGKHRDAVAPEVPHDGDAVAVDAVRLRMVLPPSDERCDPRFEHADAATLPCLAAPGATISVVMGKAFGARSPCPPPVPGPGAMLMHATLEPGGVLLVLPECDERLIYLADPNGTLMVDHTEVPPLGAAVVAAGEEVQVYSPTGATDVLVMGGACVDAPLETRGWPAWDAGAGGASDAAAVEDNAGGSGSGSAVSSDAPEVIHQWHDFVARAPPSSHGQDPGCEAIARAKLAWEQQDASVFPPCE